MSESFNKPSHLQEFGYSEERSFTTGPAPGSDESVRLLAIADLGFCEEDGSMTYAGNYPNPIATLPVGMPAEIKQEVSHAQSHLRRVPRVLSGVARTCAVTAGILRTIENDVP